MDPDWFFTVDDFSHPELTGKERAAINQFRTRRALRVCGACPIQQACLSNNLGEEFGIYGGLTQGQRKALVTDESEAFSAEPMVTS